MNPTLTTVTVNGVPRQVAATTTVADIVATLGVGRGVHAVEVNGRVVPRALHAACVVAPADVIEVVTLVGGG